MTASLIYLVDFFVALLAGVLIKMEIIMVSLFFVLLFIFFFFFFLKPELFIKRDALYLNKTTPLDADLVHVLSTSFLFVLKEE